MKAFRDVSKLLVGTSIVLTVCTMVGARLTAAGGSRAASPWVASEAQAPEAKATIWDGVFTDAQAKRGAEVYKARCAYCHRDDMRGGFFDDGNGRAPALAGKGAFFSSFSERWNQLTMAEMLGTISAVMPQNAPGSLTPQAYIDVISFLLEKNDVPAGSTELPIDEVKLKQILITEKPKN